MNELIESIRAGVADGASDDRKVAAANACRTLLTVLETATGKQMAPPGVPAPHPLAGIEPGQALDLLIARLRAVLPADGEPAKRPPEQAVRFAFVTPAAAPRRK